MKRIVFSVLLLSMALLTGCAIQGPVPLDKAYWTNKPESVGVIVAKLPPATAHKQGSQGLLDLAINSAMAGPLEKHLSALKLDEFRETGRVVANHFSRQGIPTMFIDEELDVTKVPKVKKAPKGTTTLDFASLKAKYNVDHLVVLEAVAAGTVRSYYGFVPLTAPQGYFACRGTLVDLKDNKILWYANSTQQIVVEDPWDQADEAFPHVTSAFYRALEAGKTGLIRDLVVPGAPAMTSSTR
jgi:hypothetical protein